MNLTCPLPATLRRDIVDTLDRADDSFTVTTLREYDSEHDEEVKTAASIAYHKRAAGDSAERERALEQLSQSIRAYGPDYEARRRVALAGLVLLGRLDLMKDITETIGESEPVSVGLSRGVGPNVLLVRLLAQHWRQLKEAFPEGHLNRLSKHSSPVWEVLCLGGTETPDFKDDALNAIRTNETLRRHPHALLFLSRLSPRSPELRQACIAALDHPVDTAWPEIPDSAASIFVEHFGGDAESLELLLRSRVPQLSDDGLVLALCGGWPDHPHVSQLYTDLQGRGRRVRYQTLFAITYAATPASELPQRLRRDISTVPRAALPHLTSAIVQRLRRDEEAREAFARLLAMPLSVGANATLPRLLAAAGALRLDHAQWCEDELRRQLADGVIPDVGFDLIEGRPRAVSASLLDALQGESLFSLNR
jgi:hypothetical protein